MSSTVEQIKERLSIVDVVSSYIKLEKAGRNLKARCPFHNERTPSFFVSPERETYHCFGCNKGGDIFSFAQEVEGLDFPGALAILAERAGVPIHQFDSGKQKEKERSYSILENATLYFQSQLARHTNVLNYLKQRSLQDKTITDFRVGFVPHEWRSLSLFLRGKGFHENDLEKAGLIVRSERGHYDRFRGRIIFPIADAGGRIVAFSGRIFPTCLDSAEPAEDESASPALPSSSYQPRRDEGGQAKYINSPETTLYEKSRILYGFDKAKTAIRQQNSCILVEGQMDVLMSHQCGIHNTVAASGTALTSKHLNLLSRMTDNIILAFDADEAGLQASGRGINLALSLGFNVSLVNLPKGQDPAQVIADNKERWLSAVGGAQHVVDFYLDVLKDAGYEQRLFQQKVRKLVLPYVAHIQSKIDQAHFVSKIAKDLEIGEEPVWEELKRTENDSKDNFQSAYGTARKPQATNGSLSPHELRQKKIEERFSGLLLWQEQRQKPIIDLTQARKDFELLTKKSIKKWVSERSSEEKERIVFEAEMYYNHSEVLKDDLRELIINLKEHLLRGRLVKAMNELKKAEQHKDEALSAEKLKKCNEISQELNELTLKKTEKAK